MRPHRLLYLTFACLFAANASQAEDAPLTLQMSHELTLTLARSQPRLGPIFFDADRIDSQSDGSVHAQGKVSARALGESFQADWVRYDPHLDEIHAKGNVVLQQGDRRLKSTEIRLRLSDHIGEVHNAFFLIETDRGLTARGSAERVSLLGRDRYRLESSAYTTCPVGKDDWLLKTDNLNLDYITKIGQARDIKLEYLGTPILYAPWLDFSLDKSRKTGFLAPTIGASDDRGVELIAPWYWNIAANRDASLTPRLMSRRGLQLGADFRYLQHDYQGTLSFEALPEDAVTGEGRYRGRLDHTHQFNPRLSGKLELENVSDDAYFTDLSNLVGQTSQIHLNREARLSYDGRGWNALARLQAYQTLQDPDPAKTSTRPYNRLPQIQVQAEQAKWLGNPFHINLNSELVNFEHESTRLATGTRFHFYPSIDAAIERTYGYIKPKLGLQHTGYELERNPEPVTGTPRATSLNRTMPVFSLDAGAQYERDWQIAGNDFLQTLEPRLYYLRIPAKDQTALPVFDTTVADLSYSQLFSENQFIGVDRINDANQLTLAVTSRLLEPATGLERLQVTLGQRYYFDDQRVTWPDPSYVVRGNNATDLLAQVAGQFTERWRADSGFQYNPDDGELARANLGAAYRAGPGRLINADLRYINERYSTTGLNQFDLSWQWPINANWHSLGRINYSFFDDRLVEGLLGFEYNAGCWALRAVMQKLATTSTDSTMVFFLQLELQGLTQLGPNPLDVLKRSITGYTKSDELNLH